MFLTFPNLNFVRLMRIILNSYNKSITVSTGFVNEKNKYHFLIFLRFPPPVHRSGKGTFTRSKPRLPPPFRDFFNYFPLAPYGKKQYNTAVT